MANQRNGLLTISHANPDVHLEDIACTEEQHAELTDQLEKHVLRYSKPGVPCMVEVDDIKLMIHPERVVMYWTPEPVTNDA